jgi:hypothetical protein
LGLIFSALSLVGILYLLPYNSAKPSYTGLDILHDSSVATKGFISVQIIKGSQDVLVVMKLNDWSDVSPDCKTVEFRFPGRTLNHSYMLDLQSWDDPRVGDSNATSVPINDAAVSHDDLLNQDIIRVEPAKLKDFGGVISFTWVNGLKQVGFGRYRLFLQFGATRTPDMRLNHTTAFKVGLVIPSNLDIVAQAPQEIGTKSMGPTSFYWFQMEPANSVLNLTLEDGDKTRLKELLFVLFGTLLCIGLTLIVELAVSSGRDKTEIARFVKNERAQVKESRPGSRKSGRKKRR